jgi:hypothetical protein
VSEHTHELLRKLAEASGAGRQRAAGVLRSVEERLRFLLDL